MAFASLDRQNATAPVAEINMVPLIDVMLVLPNLTRTRLQPRCDWTPDRICV